MVQSKRNIPHYTYVDECDVTELVTMREREKTAFAGNGAKLTYLAFVVKATAAALKEVPAVNASLDDAAGEIVLHDHVNIGIAVATPSGLIVPVIHDADQKSLLDLAREVERLSADGKSYLQPGIYYVNGSINFALGLSKTNASSVTFVATGSIAISSPTMNFTPYSQGVVFFANLGNGTPTTSTGFNISGSNGSWSGLAYVPWSNAQISGSANTTIAGSVVADTIHVSGSNAHLTANAGFFPQPQAEIVLYE